MGACMSGESKDSKPQDDSGATKSTKNNKAKAEPEKKKPIRVLLLGTGEQGKSTIFKRAVVTHSDGISEEDKQDFVMSIKENIIEALQNLTSRAASVADQYDMFKVSAANSRHSDLMRNLDVKAEQLDRAEVVEAVKALWADPAIQETWKYRADIQVPDTAEYFIKRVDEIATASFAPTMEDVLKCRDRTTGIIEREVVINDAEFKLVDVGGQSIEREKWKHVFQGTGAIVYVVAISEYNQSMYEDEKTNRLQDAYDTWETIINHGFKEIPFLLVFNKTDLFKQKLESGLDNAKFDFNGYKGSQNYGEIMEHVSDSFEAMNRDKKPSKIFFKCALSDNMDDLYDSIAGYYKTGDM